MQLIRCSLSNFISFTIKRDRSLIINIGLVACCWFLSLHPTFMMHGHENLKPDSTDWQLLHTTSNTTSHGFIYHSNGFKPAETWLIQPTTLTHCINKTTHVRSQKAEKWTWTIFNNCPIRCDLFSLLHFCRQLYMFRVLTPTIRSWYSCNYSFWYWLTAMSKIRCY